jgi:hypothetical protein
VTKRSHTAEEFIQKKIDLLVRWLEKLNIEI